ncbi:MAG TPA: extracellular solute-binding protein [Phycisphaerales bacterium]|nr:extracellular solute-binding protein [Phycisphaerales bacterium]
MAQKVAILAALLLVLSLPFIVRATSASRARGPSVPEGTPTLVVITPHVEQIRDEFERAFDRWHLRTRNSRAAIDWRIPGGTSDIIKQLESTLEAAARNGLIDEHGAAKPGAAGCDVFLGGGSYEHGGLKKPRTTIGPSGKPVSYRLSQPVGFTQKQLDDWFGPNKIGTQFLYDPEQYWIGTALSGFGIVYNKDVLSRLGVPEPKTFDDLGDSRLFNLVALADGRQSGSVTTTYDSILNKEGWDRGWRTLREMSANARYFASSSTKPPIDVSQGDAAAGLAIDFYGRSQAQCLLKPGQDPSESRVGYIDPAGAVFIDADPATILNGAANPGLAKAFIEFCLSDEAQALWQMPATSHASGRNNPIGPGGLPLGPEQYDLRRMPVRRDMYDKYGQYFIDKANPFAIASDVKSRNWRNLIAPLMAAFAIDVAPDLRSAWQTLNHARALAAESRMPPDHLAAMEREFYAMPPHTMRDGAILELNEANFKAIEEDTGKWKDLDHGKRSLIAYTRFFRDQYRKVVQLGNSAN